MSERDSTRTSWLAAVGLLAVTSVVGCDAPIFKGKGSEDDGPVGRRSEAVVVDYYKASSKVRSCAGTLLSSNVVIAPAHCADGTTKAVVNVLDSQKTRTSVSRVYTYDWVSADPSMVRSQRHDVALLVLRKPVAKARFARIQSSKCAGCTVVQIGRTRDSSGRVLGISKRLRLAKNVSNETAFRMPLASSKVTKRGGAVYRVTKKDERVIVGLVVGRTKNSGQGVVVPLTNAVMQKWIRAIVKTEGNQALSETSGKTSSALSTKNLRFLDEEENTTNNEEPAASNSEPQQEQVEDERPQQEQQSDPAPAQDTESQNQGSEPVVEQPSSEEQPAAQENTPSENTGSENTPSENTGSENTPSENTGSENTPSENTGSENTPAEPRNDPSDPVVPTGENQTEPQSSPDREAQPAPSSSQPGSYEDAQAAANPETPTETNSGTPSETNNGTPSETNVRAGGNDTNPPYPGNIAGVGALRAPARDEETTNHPGGNSVTVASPGDPAFKDDAQLAQRYAGTANLYNSHGMPGTLVGGVPTETVQRFMQDDKPLIVASCFSGAPMSGGSTIRRMASTYGGDPERIYGCSGYASGDNASGIGCTGTWVNGNGRAVPQEERSRLGLNQYQCSTNTLDSNNRPVWDDCAAN